MDFKYEKNKIYLENEDGKLVAEIDFPNVSENEVNICHTFVDSSLRGQGMADKLTTAAVEHLKKNNKKIQASCPYAIGWFDKHPEYNNIYKS